MLSPRLWSPLLATLMCVGLHAHAEDLDAGPLLSVPEVAEVAAVELADSSPAVVPAEAEEEDTQELEQALREEHPWAAWEPGAWRRIRVISEAFDAKGESIGRGVTERTERLVACDEKAYELEVEEVALLSGRPTPSPVERQKLWLATDRPCELGEPTFSSEPGSSISLGGAMTPCRVWRVEQPTGAGSEVTLLHLSGLGDSGSVEANLGGPARRGPTILRREVSAATDGAPGSQLVESLAGAGAPILFEESLIEGWRRLTAVTRSSGGRSQAVSVHSNAVPGGLHHESLAEYDAEGVCVRLSVIDLLAAGSTPEGELASQAGEEGDSPALSIEVRPRRFLRLLRRRAEEGDEEEQPAPEPLQ